MSKLGKIEIRIVMKDGSQARFAKNRIRRSEEPESTANFKGVRGDIEVRGGQQRPNTSAENAPENLEK